MMMVSFICSCRNKNSPTIYTPRVLPTIRGCSHAHTDKQTKPQMPHHRSPSPTRTLCLCCCQIKAWKSGHKGECMAAARADTRTAAKPTADQMRVLKILEQLDGAADWRGVAAQERAARAVASAVRTSMPIMAAWVYCILGSAYQNLGSFSKALEHHSEHLAISKEMGDRAWEGRAYGNLTATRMLRRATSARTSSTTAAPGVVAHKGLVSAGWARSASPPERRVPLRAQALARLDGPPDARRGPGQPVQA
jgi:hypothetical protein